MRNTFLERVVAQRELERVEALAFISMKPLRANRWKRVPREKILELHNAGLTQKQISAQLGCRPATVCLALRAKGVRIYKPRTPKAMLQRIVDLHAEGRTYEYISETLGVELVLAYRTVARMFRGKKDVFQRTG